MDRPIVYCIYLVPSDLDKFKKFINTSMRSKEFVTEDTSSALFDLAVTALIGTYYGSRLLELYIYEKVKKWIEKKHEHLKWGDRKEYRELVDRDLERYERYGLAGLGLFRAAKALRDRNKDR